MSSGNNVETAIKRLYEVRAGGRTGKLEKVDMPESNRKAIIAYDKFLSAKGIGTGRRIQVIDTLRRWQRYVKKDWKAMTKEDLVNAVAALNDGKLSDSCKELWKIVLRQFYGWLYGCKEHTFPDKVDWIRVNMKKYCVQANHKELITPSQLDLIIACASDIQTKAFVKVMYESACRAHELLKLTVGSITEDEYGMKLAVPKETKTGERTVRIVESVPILKEYLNRHPEAKNPDAPLFCHYYKGKLTTWRYPETCSLLKTITTKAKSLHPELSGKKVNMHSFRKARLSELAPRLPDAVMKKYAGWTKDSRMAKVYCDISDENQDEAVLRSGYGVTKAESAAPLARVKVCPHCKAPNDSSFSLCGQCSRVLTAGDAIKIDLTVDEMRAEMMNLKKQLSFVEEKLLDKATLKSTLKGIITETMQEIITAKVTEKSKASSP